MCHKHVFYFLLFYKWQCLSIWDYQGDLGGCAEHKVKAFFKPRLPIIPYNICSFLHDLGLGLLRCLLGFGFLLRGMLDFSHHFGGQGFCFRAIFGFQEGLVRETKLVAFAVQIILFDISLGLPELLQAVAEAIAPVAGANNGRKLIPVEWSIFLKDIKNLDGILFILGAQPVLDDLLVVLGGLADNYQMLGVLLVFVRRDTIQSS